MVCEVLILLFMDGGGIPNHIFPSAKAGVGNDVVMRDEAMCTRKIPRRTPPPIVYMRKLPEWFRYLFLGAVCPDSRVFMVAPPCLDRLIEGVSQHDFDYPYGL